MDNKTAILTDFAGDCAAKLKSAGDYLRDNPGATLIIPEGVYCIHDPRAIEIRADVFAGKYGYNPQPTMFSPDFPYTVALDLTGCKDVTVSAEGAKLMIDGYMEPVSIRNASGVTIDGLTIDHIKKPFCRAVVTEVGDGYGILRFDPDNLPSADMSSPREMTFDSDGRITDREFSWANEKEQIDGCTWKLYDKFRDTDVGMKVYFCTTYHFRPGILISHSERTTLTGVTIHSQPGMGIVGFKSRDIHISSLSIVPSDGYDVSTNTDATHFSSCSGTITVENSRFRGHGDDAINVHNYYYAIAESNGTHAVLTVRTPDGTHSQEQDYPMPGYKLELVKKSTLEPYGIYEVLSATEGDPCSVTLDSVIPDGDYMFANLTDVPKLIFRGNDVREHLARSVLCKTHGALIENNSFEHNTGTAVHIAAEAQWGEGIATENVTVRGNTFTNCGFCSHGRMNGTSAVRVNTAADFPIGIGLHKNIVIENNRVACPQTADYAFSIANAKNVRIERNECTGYARAIACVAYSEDITADFDYEEN